MAKTALVIGSNGGIATELVRQLCESEQYTAVYTVSRTHAEPQHHKQHVHCFDTCDESQIEGFLQTCKAQQVQFDYVVCATGILHGSGDTPLKPEKRLEDMQPAQYAEYFRVNTVLPASWLKYLVKHINKASSTLVFFSARVGSISENGLGGWYGYRASKAALNMVVKTAAIEYKRRAPNAVLMCYHPGTVDTGLSKPFQANVKPGKLFTPAFTVESLLQVSSDLSAEHSPYYLDWKGETISW